MGPARPEIGQRGEIAKGLKGRKRLSLREKERGQLLAPPRLCPTGKPKLQESQEQGISGGSPIPPCSSCGKHTEQKPGTAPTPRASGEGGAGYTAPAGKEEK